MRKKYAVVGTGGRAGGMFIYPIASEYREEAQLVGFCDPSRLRMQHHVDELRNNRGCEDPVAFYGIEDFDRMLSEQKPDTVIICSMDSTHADYIVRTLKSGCNAIVEKPIAVDAPQCAAILDAANASKNSIRVTFNYRWSPGVTKVWELLEAGTIGKVHHVHFEYLLNTSHGADYFRRWHSKMENSGGLLVHKSTHHFDLVNWWLNSIPETVFANGKLCFYGEQNAVQRGDGHLTGYERYLDPASEGDPFRLDISKNMLYYGAEKDNGYIRDKNVFRDGIDIYDTMSVAARYRSGAFLTYSLVAYSPYEAFRVSFTGDRGRIEYSETHETHLILGQSDKELAPAQNKRPEGMKRYELRVFPHFERGREIEIQEATGGHGGGDPLIQDQMFKYDPPQDHARRSAGHEQGIASAMLGICANESIKTGLAVRVADLLPIRPDATSFSELI